MHLYVAARRNIMRSSQILQALREAAATARPLRDDTARKSVRRSLDKQITLHVQQISGTHEQVRTTLRQKYILSCLGSRRTDSDLKRRHGGGTGLESKACNQFLYSSLLLCRPCHPIAVLRLMLVLLIEEIA